MRNDKRNGKKLICGSCLSQRLSFLIHYLSSFRARLAFSFVLIYLCHSLAAFSQVQMGLASFYSKRATGSRTANGERLHHDSMTCAHRTFPFGTRLRVTNMSNNQQVVVRVNDRGPYVQGRIIDLSWGAANKINMIGRGITKVSVESADGIVIPLLPPVETITFPKLEIDSIELINRMTPIWQEDLLIDHQDMQRHMRRTTQKVIQHRINTMFKKR